MEDYKEVMRYYFRAVHKRIDRNIILSTYIIWRERNPTRFPRINAITLANQRRYIVNKKKLTNIEIQTIEEEEVAMISRQQYRRD